MFGLLLAGELMSFVLLSKGFAGARVGALSEGSCFLGLPAVYSTLWVGVSCFGCFVSPSILILLMGPLSVLSCSLMAHVKKTAKLVDSLEAVDSSSDVAVSFELGLSRFTLRELDEFMKLS
jgi:hypothetical protein